MISYSVSKQYGHFVQIWEIQAESKELAWDRADIDGRLQYQTVYGEINPASNYVVNMDENRKENMLQPEIYDKWLKEAIELGMKVDNYGGLPFSDVR